MFSDKSGRVQDEIAFLLTPGNYNNSVYSDLPGLPWVCPIRSCRYAFLKSSSLDAHWAVCYGGGGFLVELLLTILSQRTHRKCLLNDNNDGTFSIKGDYQPKKARTANAIVISRSPLDYEEPPMAETRSFRQVQMQKSTAETPSLQGDKREKRPTADIKPDGVLNGSGVMGRVIIPEDHTMATNIRSYREWPSEERNFPALRVKHCVLTVTVIFR